MNDQTKKPNKSYTSEFKESAVKLANETDQPVSQTARELGVNVNTLHTWISKYSKPVKTVANRSDEHIYDEVKRLKKELAKVIQERDLLKRPQRTLQGKVRMDN
nr:transposase [sulfur-oxidizing endosymbiont of Gigantopelta aegis]